MSPVMLFDEPASAHSIEMVGEVLEVMKQCKGWHDHDYVLHEMGFARGC